MEASKQRLRRLLLMVAEKVYKYFAKGKYQTEIIRTQEDSAIDKYTKACQTFTSGKPIKIEIY